MLAALAVSAGSPPQGYVVGVFPLLVGAGALQHDHTNTVTQTQSYHGYIVRAVCLHHYAFSMYTACLNRLVVRGTTDNRRARRLVVHSE